uniref:MyTH4 domain-containing protein n=1 Tax=Eptatretus burgeri TaxID=7764 RepID=A0A8C4R4N7_EPTBU
MANAEKEVLAALSQLDVPADLARLLRFSEATPLFHNANFIRVAVTLQSNNMLNSLPADINDFPFSRFAQSKFKSGKFGCISPPLDAPITTFPNQEDVQTAITLFKLVVRFMSDNSLTPSQDFLFGNYIIQFVLENPDLQIELLSQIVNQTWQNPHPGSAQRGWLLLANCLSSFRPPSEISKFLLKYVSDHAYNGFKAVCQRKLLHSLATLEQQNLERHFPPCLLEWISSKNCARMALPFAFPDGVMNVIEVDSCHTGEVLASQMLQMRGLNENSLGWTLSMCEGGNWCELPGHDLVLDLIGDCELPLYFPKRPSFFLLSSASGPKAHFFAHLPSSSAQLSRRRSSTSLQMNNDYEDLIPPPPSFSPSLPPNEQERAGGLDQFVDYLFDPLADLMGTESGSVCTLSSRMKGGGRMWRGPPPSQQPGNNPAGVPPVGPIVPSFMQPLSLPVATSTFPMAPIPMMDPTQLMAQQQAYINQQAYAMAQQMAAAALQQQQHQQPQPQFQQQQQPQPQYEQQQQAQQQQQLLQPKLDVQNTQSADETTAPTADHQREKPSSSKSETFEDHKNYFQKLSLTKPPISRPVGKTLMTPPPVTVEKALVRSDSHRENPDASAETKPPDIISPDDGGKAIEHDPDETHSLTKVAEPEEDDQVQEEATDHPTLPNPTHNIRNIIKIYNQHSEPKLEIPQPVRKPSDSRFDKKSDPRKEALSILKKGTTNGSSHNDNDSLNDPSLSTNSLSLQSSSDGSNTSSPTRPSPPPPFQGIEKYKHKKAISASLSQAMAKVAAALGATASPEVMENEPEMADEGGELQDTRSYFSDDERIKTELHPWHNDDFYSYDNVTWTLHIRKEIFYPKESFTHPLLLNLLVNQIVQDTFSENCIRITKDEKNCMRNLLEEHKVHSAMSITDEFS